MARALLRGHRQARRRGVRRRAGALRRHPRRARRPPRRPGLPGGPRLPPGRRRSACSPTRCGHPRSRTARSSGWCATGSTRSRTSWPTPARRAAKELSKELFPATARMSRPRQGTEETVAAHRRGGRTRLLRRARPPRHGHRRRRRRPHRHRPRRRCSPTPWAPGPGNTAEPRPVPPVTADDTGRVVIVDRPGRGADAAADRPHRRRPARPGVARPGARHVLPGRHPHLPPGPRAARGEGLHLRRAGVRPGAALGARTGTGAAMLAISGSVDTPNTGPALDDLWKVLRTLAAEGLTDAERDVAVQNLVGRRAAEVRDRGGRRGHARRPGRAAPAGRLPGGAVRAARRDRHRGGDRGRRERLPGGPAGDGPRRRRRADRGARQGARHRRGDRRHRG